MKSRYGQERHLKKIDDDTYIVYGESAFMRGAEDMVDFEGGPMLQVGDDLSIFGHPDLVIKKIEYTNHPHLSNCYTLKINSKLQDAMKQLEEVSDKQRQYAKEFTKKHTGKEVI